MLLLFCFFTCSISPSYSKEPPDRLNLILKQIAFREKEIGLEQGSLTPIMEEKNGYLFESEVKEQFDYKSIRALSPKERERFLGPYTYRHRDRTLKVRTVYSNKKEGIEKNIKVSQGMDQNFFRMTFKDNAGPYRSYIQKMPQGDILVFDRSLDTMLITQHILPDGSVTNKEWIYARSPNTRNGSRYAWKFENAPFDWSHYLTVEGNKEGTLSLYNNMIIQNVKKDDQKEKTRIERIIKELLGGLVTIKDHEEITRIAPITYWTRDGGKKFLPFNVVGEDTIEATIDEPPQAYPLLIDPVLTMNPFTPRE